MITDCGLKVATVASGWSSMHAPVLNYLLGLTVSRVSIGLQVSTWV